MYVHTLHDVFLVDVCVCVCVVMPQLLSHQHKPMKSRQKAISEYLASELEHMGCS